MLMWETTVKLLIYQIVKISTDIPGSAPNVCAWQVGAGKATVPKSALKAKWRGVCLSVHHLEEILHSTADAEAEEGEEVSALEDD